MDGGNLRSYLDKKRCNMATSINFSTLDLAWVIADGLADIQYNRCIHRDLKSHNILLSTKKYFKLADFGLTHNIDTSMTRGVGTLAWIAPEVLTGERYGFPAEIYSFGVVLTELDTREIPYLNLQLFPYAFMNGVCNGSLRPSLRQNCSLCYKKWVENCLAHDPSQRPTALEIVSIIHAQLFPKDQAIQSEYNQLNTTQVLSKLSIEDNKSSTKSIPSTTSLSKSVSTLDIAEIRCPK
ncbi:kinase [Thraustotheca clavata]|uniref:Kinase n=1 Tax=Thraustotheca clavata TaxID=74557 RepID=A0A1W0A3H3_9STRA|nr:kinase [Thraustotheca clavata]